MTEPVSKDRTPGKTRPRVSSTARRVLKFGGAGLRDGAGITRIARIIAQAPERSVVVVSAMHGVTDRLEAGLDRITQDESEVFMLVESLRDGHDRALRHVAPYGDDAAAYALRTGLERLERLLYGIAYTQELTPRLRDLVLSFGERLSTPLVAAAVRVQGREAVALDAEHAGIRTLGPFGSARADLDALQDAATDALGTLLDAGQTPIVTGFYGVDGHGHATLFGRGGSDYVASLLGRALGAEAVELWKEDVAGFLTADPRAVADARIVPELGYDEAAELAQFGAKVLHPRAVEPLEDMDIPIHIRCVQAPDAPGSVIRGDVPPAARQVRSVAGKDRLAILRLNGPGMAYTPGVAKQVFDRLAGHGINVLNMSTSQATFALLLDETDVESAEAALRPLVGGIIRSIERFPDRSLVCAVGRGLGDAPGSAGRILAAVGAGGVNVEMISVGASDIAIDFIVKSADRDRAMQCVHDAFHDTGKDREGKVDKAAHSDPFIGTDARTVAPGGKA